MVPKKLIEVEVRLYGKLSEYSSQAEVGKAMVFPLQENTSLSSLLDQLHLPLEEVKLVFVNNQQRNNNYKLSDGDRVAIFPVIAGG